MDRTMPEGATYLDDISGLKLSDEKAYTKDELYLLEAKNIARATLNYLSRTPTTKEAPFDYDWMLDLHQEMFGDVWEWAGKLRQVELSIGIKAYLVGSELKKLADDIAYWETHNTYELFEAAARIHHRAVQIHPFVNGNGRWSRMLANIWLRLHGEMPTNWEESLLSQENANRDRYIAALKSADQGDYEDLIALQKNVYVFANE